MGLKLLRWILLACSVSALALALGRAPLTMGASSQAVQLVPDLPSPQPVGTTITWSASSSGSDILAFRLSVGLQGEPLRVMYDFSPSSTFLWTPIENGRYTVVLTAYNPVTSAITNVQATFDIASRVQRSPIVTGTQNPLVALYSAPPCRSGAMRVTFWRPGSQMIYTTNSKPCQRGRSMNFYVAGMRADTAYWIRHEIVDSYGNVTSRGPTLTHHTGVPGIEFPTFTVLDPPDSQTSVAESILLQSPSAVFAGLPPFPVATDFSGQVVWYYQTPLVQQIATYVTRPVAGGTLLLIAPGGAGIFAQELREIDLAGNTVRETNARRVSDQLVQMGEDPINGFHHEAIRLPSGHTLVIAGVEKILQDVQGPGPVDILGDMVVDLDQNWQVVWAWNSFDHLDVTRKASLDENCAVTCNVPLYLADNANDWTHTNSISYSPSDGNLLLSIRNQDWVVKIDYRDGTGSGDILWRLGRQGNFLMQPLDPYLWFTHQHDARLLQDGRIAVYDNGTLRCETSANPEQDCFSRGQVLRIDEANHRAYFDLNAVLGNYSLALGSAQQLSNGNFAFTSGIQVSLADPGVFAWSDELLPDGTKTFSLKTDWALYRSFRMRDLYTP